MNIQTVQHPRQDIEVEAVTILTADTMRELRDSDWHDGQLAVLTYPTAQPIGFIGVDAPKSLSGPAVYVGDTLIKGPAGDLEVIRAEEWWG